MLDVVNDINIQSKNYTTVASGFVSLSPQT